MCYRATRPTPCQMLLASRHPALSLLCVFVNLNMFIYLSCCSTVLKEMLRKYGPSVPQELLHKLVNAFGELRSRADQGLISYPYSTREVVSVVKHLQVTIAPSRNACYDIYVTQLVTQCILDIVRQVTVVTFARRNVSRTMYST